MKDMAERVVRRRGLILKLRVNPARKAEMHSPTAGLKLDHADSHPQTCFWE
jgi:hypothetical protein